MISELIKNFSWKYTVWGSLCLLVVHYGHWYGYFKQLGLDVTYSEITISSLFIAISNNFGFLFNIVFIYLQGRDKHFDEIRENAYSKISKKYSEKLEEYGLSAEQIEDRKLFEILVNDKKIIIEWNKLKSISKLNCLLTDLKSSKEIKEFNSEFIKFEEGIDNRAIKGAISFFSLLRFQKNKLKQTELNDLYQKKLRRLQAMIEVNRIYKTEWIILIILLIILIAGLIRELWNGNYSILLPNIFGFLLGYFLTLSEKIKRINGKVFMLSFILIVIWIYTFNMAKYEASNAINSKQIFEIKLNNGETYQGRKVFSSESTIILITEDSSILYFPKNSILILGGTFNKLVK